jgi:hypothetical protein
MTTVKCFVVHALVDLSYFSRLRDLVFVTFKQMKTYLIYVYILVGRRTQPTVESSDELELKLRCDFLF